MVSQRGVVVVVFVALQLGGYLALGAADTDADADATVDAWVVIMVLLAQQRVVSQRKLVARYKLPAARVAPEALHVINFSLGPHHEFGPVKAQVALITFGAK